VEWTVDSIIGNLYSMSFCTRKVLGERAEAFERDLRSAILAVEPSGIFRGKEYQFFAVMAFKRWNESLGGCRPLRAGRQG
jgi:hypothetical protein